MGFVKPGREWGAQCLGLGAKREALGATCFWPYCPMLVICAVQFASALKHAILRLHRARARPGRTVGAEEAAVSRENSGR